MKKLLVVTGGLAAFIACEEEPADPRIRCVVVHSLGGEYVETFPAIGDSAEVVQTDVLELAHNLNGFVLLENVCETAQDLTGLSVVIQGQLFETEFHAVSQWSNFHTEQVLPTLRSARTIPLPAQSMSAGESLIVLASDRLVGESTESRFQTNDGRGTADSLGWTTVIDAGPDRNRWVWQGIDSAMVVAPDGGGSAGFGYGIAREVARNADGSPNLSLVSATRCDSTATGTAFDVDDWSFSSGIGWGTSRDLRFDGQCGCVDPLEVRGGLTDNDSRASATPVPLPLAAAGSLSRRTVLHPRIQPNDPVDWFKVDVPPGCSVFGGHQREFYPQSEQNVSWTTAEGNALPMGEAAALAAEVAAQRDTFIQWYLDADAGDEHSNEAGHASWLNTTSKTQTVYYKAELAPKIRRAMGACDPYDFTVVVDCGEPATDDNCDVDAFEADAGDDELANAVALSAEAKSTLLNTPVAADRDFRSFTVEAGTRASAVATIIDPDNAMTVSVVFTRNGNVVQPDTDGFLTNSTDARQTYVAEISGTGSTCAAYSLDVLRQSLRVQPRTADCTTGEPANGTLDGALAVALTPTTDPTAFTEISTNVNPGDVDLSTINVASGCTFQLGSDPNRPASTRVIAPIMGVTQNTPAPGQPPTWTVSGDNAATFVIRVEGTAGGCVTQTDKARVLCPASPDTYPVCMDNDADLGSDQNAHAPMLFTFAAHQGRGGSRSVTGHLQHSIDTTDAYAVQVPHGCTAYARADAGVYGVPITMSLRAADSTGTLASQGPLVFFPSWKNTNDSGETVTIVAEVSLLSDPAYLVSEDAGSCEPYSAGVGVTCPADCAADRLEPSDSTSDSIVTGVAEAGDAWTGTTLSTGGDDEDWMKVTIPHGCTLDAGLAFKQTDGNIDLSLLNSDGTLVAESATSTDNERISYKNDGGISTFYALADSTDAGCMSYTASLSLACPEPGSISCPTDTNEPDGSVALATDTGLDTHGETYRVSNASLGSDSSDSSDLYEVTVDTDCTLAATATFNASNDLSLSIIGSSGSVLASGSNVENGVATTWTQTGSSGAAFLRLSTSEDTCVPYTLEASLSCSGDVVNDCIYLTEVYNAGPGSFVELYNHCDAATDITGTSIGIYDADDPSIVTVFEIPEVDDIGPGDSVVIAASTDFTTTYFQAPTLLWPGLSFDGGDTIAYGGGTTESTFFSTDPFGEIGQSGIGMPWEIPFLGSAHRCTSSNDHQFNPDEWVIDASPTPFDSDQPGCSL